MKNKKIIFYLITISCASNSLSMVSPKQEDDNEENDEFCDDCTLKQIRKDIYIAFRKTHENREIVERLSRKFCAARKLFSNDEQLTLQKIKEGILARLEESKNSYAHADAAVWRKDKADITSANHHLKDANNSVKKANELLMEYEQKITERLPESKL